MIHLLQATEAFDPEIASEFAYAVTSGPTFLGVPVIESQSLLHLIIRFSFNFLVSFVLARLIYYRKGGRRDYLATFLIFSSAMFLMVFLMDSVNVEIGLTLGLFAIFGVIRYRTETVPIREMTHLFVIIAISVINGLALNITYTELVLANALILCIVALCEWARNRSRAFSKIILYDRIDLISPERRAELISDLEARTGLDIQEIEVGSVDFLKDSAYIKIHYKPIPDESDTIGCSVKNR